MNTKFQKIFDDYIIDEASLFYSFMRMTTKELSDKIELGDVKMSHSTHHRSNTYMLFGNYKPNSKLNISNVFVDEN